MKSELVKKLDKLKFRELLEYIYKHSDLESVMFRYNDGSNHKYDLKGWVHAFHEILSRGTFANHRHELIREFL